MVLVVASRKKHSEEMAFELGTVNVRREQISIKCLLTPFYVPGSTLGLGINDVQQRPNMHPNEPVFLREKMISLTNCKNSATNEQRGACGNKTVYDRGIRQEKPSGGNDV